MSLMGNMMKISNGERKRGRKGRRRRGRERGKENGCENSE
jgi:hypothetical protein